MVEVSVTVGKLDASLALLLTKDHHLIEFPTLLLPNDVEPGSIVKISCERDSMNEKNDRESFDKVQNEILNEFGVNEPLAPNLQIKNITQTSVVLEWDPINVATAELLSLTLFKNNQRFGQITSPLKRTSTKISGLAIDNAYTFHLVLATTAGIYSSEKVTIKTHKMTDLSGITMCVGDLSGSQIDEVELAETAKKIGAKPLQHHVKVDTTHFVCTIGTGSECRRAQDLNIPVVTPEWVKACENERRLVGVKRYYLDADPKDRPPLQQRPRAQSQTTNGSASSIPQVKVTEPEKSGDEKEEAVAAGEQQPAYNDSQKSLPHVEEQAEPETSQVEQEPEQEPEQEQNSHIVETPVGVDDILPSAPQIPATSVVEETHEADSSMDMVPEAESTLESAIPRGENSTPLSEEKRDEPKLEEKTGEEQQATLLNVDTPTERDGDDMESVNLDSTDHLPPQPAAITNDDDDNNNDDNEPENNGNEDSQAEQSSASTSQPSASNKSKKKKNKKKNKK